MTYKVFLVEDEITTREGIRDNVDWRAASFELCGEAPDGEIALPQIEAIQPDVLITDIRMPFMDGLQLCKIVREHMAWMKIIIISGYNDFQYAQTAIQLGVTEYLLKPVSVQDLQSVLNKVAYALDQEKSERAYLKRLRSQVEDNLALLRDKFLLRLVTGGESSLSAIEQSQQLGLNILAPFYQVALLQVRTVNSGQVLDYAACQQVEKIVSELLGTNMEVLLTKKDMEEFVLILKGENQEQIEEESAFLAGLVRDEVEKRTPYRLAVGVGSPQQRMSDLHCSFAEALVQLQDPRETQIVNELKKLDYVALRSYLEHGQIEEFETFFDQSIRPLAEAALHSNLLKHYILVDISLTTAQFVSDLGGETAQILPDLGEKDADLSAIQHLEQMKARILRIFQAALTFRDSQEGYDRAAIIHRAQKYIANHYADSNLSLNEVAAQVNFSPNHFSAVFSEQTGETFRDYLTRTRIDQARKLLRATRLKCSEVAFQCGYNDPHYFSMMFRKNCGMTPQQFRASVRN